MACRECGGATCACSYSAGPGIALSGSGSATDPLIPSVNLGSNSGMFVTGAGLFSQRWRVGTTAERTVATPISEGDWWDDTTQRRIYRRTSGAWTLVHWYGASAANAGRPAVHLSRVANFSIPNNSFTAVSWDTEVLDTEAAVAVPATSYTVPAALTDLWLWQTQISWASYHASQVVSFARNGTRYGGFSVVDSVASASFSSAGLNGIAMSTVCYQASGAAINVTGEIKGWYLG